MADSKQPASSVCPSVAAVKENYKESSYNERLQALKTEAESLYEFCLKKEFSKKQVQECLSPLYGTRPSIIQQVIAGSSKSFFMLAIFVATLAAILKLEQIRDPLIIHLKLLNFQTLKIYDWRYLYQEDCLVYNNYAVKKKLTRSDCYGCIDFTNDNTIDRLSNANTTDVLNNYLFIDWPFIVSDATRDWPRDEGGKYKFSVGNILKLYQTHGTFDKQDVCAFMTTMEEYATPLEVLDAYKAKQLPDVYHVTWHNCEPKAGKVFRRLTNRPYYLPSMTQMLPTNTVILAHGVTTDDVTTDVKTMDNWYELPSDDSAIIVNVVEGELRIALIPVEDCVKFGCQELQYSVGKGEAAVVPTRLFTVSYTPSTENTTLAFVTSTLWDEITSPVEEQQNKAEL